MLFIVSNELFIDFFVKGYGLIEGEYFGNIQGSRVIRNEQDLLLLQVMAQADLV